MSTKSERIKDAKATPRDSKIMIVMTNYRIYI